MKEREREGGRKAIRKHAIKTFPQWRYACCHDMFLKDTVKRKLKEEMYFAFVVILIQELDEVHKMHEVLF